MSGPVELSKSRFFSLQDGTIVVAEKSAGGFSQSDRLPTGTIDQKYQILGLLGQGGMGAVFRARHLMLNKDVALKTFRTANLTDEERLRFQREAQAIAKLSHKNVIQVFDFGLSEDGVPYYTMEYLMGESLGDRIKKNGPQTVAQAIGFFIPICQGLSLAHSKGIIHRDLKPANLFIENIPSAKGMKETVKIVDFGIASLTNQSAEGQKLTTFGTIFGSPLYMSPEQSRGETITERADIYSLGCALFETLTGTPPFHGANALDTIMQHQTVKPPTLKEASGGQDFPPALERVLATMLAKSPVGRQPSMDQLEAELAQFKPGQVPIDNRALRAANKTAEASDFAPIDQSSKENKTKPRHKSSWPLPLAGFLLLIGITGIAAIAYMGSRKYVVPEPSAKASGPSRTTEKGTDGKTYRVFKFHPDLDPGTFTDPNTKLVYKPATGEVRWPVDSPPKFQTSQAFLDNPANLDAFQPNDLCGLDFQECRTMKRDSKLMHQISRLTGLKSLNLVNITITDDDLSDINKLTNLEGLNLNYTGIHGKALGKAAVTKRLKSIEFTHCPGASDLLAALKDSDCVTHLYLDGDPLTPSDFKTIGMLSNLSWLQVSQTGMKSSDLASLQSLTKLTYLDAQGFKVTEKDLVFLKVLKRNGLKQLVLTKEGFAEENENQISRIIRGTELRKPASTYPLATGNSDPDTLPKPRESLPPGLEEILKK